MSSGVNFALPINLVYSVVPEVRTEHHRWFCHDAG
jgi:hypothetical protein